MKLIRTGSSIAKKQYGSCRTVSCMVETLTHAKQEEEQLKRTDIMRQKHRITSGSPFQLIKRGYT